jgi:hypothetical protein
VHHGVDRAAAGGDGQRRPPEEPEHDKRRDHQSEGTEAGRGDRAEHDDGDQEIHDGPNHVVRDRPTVAARWERPVDHGNARGDKDTSRAAG